MNSRLIAVLLIAAKGQQESQLKSIVVLCSERYNQQLFTAHCDSDIDFDTAITLPHGWPIRIEVNYHSGRWAWV